MKTYKRARARRPLRRRRKSRARKSKTLATKSYVNKMVSKATESKRTTSLYTLVDSDASTGAGYLFHVVGQNISVGVTDRGRIGNTIHLTGVQVRWVALMEWVDAGARDATINIVFVRPKNNYSAPHSRWFKSFDNALDDPYEPLSVESMNDGRRWINTDDLILLKHYKKTIYRRDGGIDKQTANGIAKLPLNKMKMIINQNGTSAPSFSDISPAIWVYMYVTLNDDAAYSESNAFTTDYAVSTYYRD